MDRIDIHVEVPRVPFDKLSDKRTGEASAAVRERVEAARAIQRERFKDTSLQTNSDMGSAEIRKFCPLDEGCLPQLRSKPLPGQQQRNW